MCPWIESQISLAFVGSPCFEGAAVAVQSRAADAHPSAAGETSHVTDCCKVVAAVHGVQSSSRGPGMRVLSI
jgi:hypothetical protein